MAKKSPKRKPAKAKAAKAKPAKKSPARKAGKKSPAKKPSKAKTSKKALALKPSRATALAGTALPKDIETRLLALALQMEKTMDAVMLQALCEFADAWEDHFNTVQTLQDEERVHLAVKPE